MVQRNTRTVGAREERRALGFLKRQGLAFVAGNFACRFGEIDLIMRDGRCLVIVEVRYRGAGRRFAAALTVDARKQSRLARSAALFLAAKPEYGAYSIRFDVVAIESDAGDGKRIEWIRDAFRPGDTTSF